LLVRRHYGGKAMDIIQCGNIIAGSETDSALHILLVRALQAVDCIDGYIGLVNAEHTSIPSIIANSMSNESSRDMGELILSALSQKLHEPRFSSIKKEECLPILLTRANGQAARTPNDCVVVLLAKVDSDLLMLCLRGLQLHHFTQQICMALQRVSELSMQLLDRFLMHRWFAQERHEVEFIGMSGAFLELETRVKRIARTHPTAPILIVGERGSGKESIARAIHYYSPQRGKPFITVNSAALQQDLYASELFGFRKGAFTGASEDRQGKFRAAESGTLFLDEITEMPANVRGGLLRALDRGEIQSIGYESSFHVNVRVIAATNKEIEKLVEAGNFPADVYDRLNVLSIRVPPLRERKEDIPLLLNYFFSRYCRFWELNGESRCPARCGANHSIACLQSEAMAALLDYDWPGNIRELRNTVLWLISESAVGCPISSEHLPPHILRRASDLHRLGSFPDQSMKLDLAITRHIVTVLNITQGNKTAAARMLGLPLSTLVSKMKRLGIDSPCGPSARQNKQLL
jgi:DNA-binding NtrC family response regulator